MSEKKCYACSTSSYGRGRRTSADSGDGQNCQAGEWRHCGAVRGYGGIDHGLHAPTANDRDFLPLTVDYRENTYSAGKDSRRIFQREGRPSKKRF